MCAITEDAGHCDKAWAAHPLALQKPGMGTRPTQSCSHGDTTTCLFAERVSAQGWALAAPQGLHHMHGRGTMCMTEAVSPGATMSSAEVNRDFIFLF